MFTRKDLGCWVDGAYGMEHAGQKLASMLSDEHHALCNELLHPEGEFYSEALDDATAILQEDTEEGLVWIWEAGDLILTEEE